MQALITAVKAERKAALKAPDVERAERERMAADWSTRTRARARDCEAETRAMRGRYEADAEATKRWSKLFDTERGKF